MIKYMRTLFRCLKKLSQSHVVLHLLNLYEVHFQGNLHFTEMSH